MPELPPVPPQGAPEEGPQEQAQDMGQQGQTKEGVQGLIVGIHSSLLQLKQLLSSAPQIPDEVKAPLDDVLNSYKGFVANLANAVQGGGQPQPEQAAPQPGMEAPPAPPKGPMPSKQVPMSGGRGARPAY